MELSTKALTNLRATADQHGRLEVMLTAARRIVPAFLLIIGASACQNSGGTEDRNTTAAASPTSQTQGPGSATFGDGCAAFPVEPNGKGSLEQLSRLPAGSALLASQALSMFGTSVQSAGLLSYLNDARDVTIFAPSSTAFQQIGQQRFTELLSDKKDAAELVKSHVVTGLLGPAQVGGTHKTLAGNAVVVEREGEVWMANRSKIQCGNITTKNAVIYMISTLMVDKK